MAPACSLYETSAAGVAGLSGGSSRLVFLGDILAVDGGTVDGRLVFGFLVVGAAVMLLIGAYAPESFMSHFIVFALACFVGFQVIWNVSHSLHTPLMAITNAISSIIILGALLQIGSGSWLIGLLAALSIVMAGVNIFGGFMVTRRMLAMFQKS